MPTQAIGCSKAQCAPIDNESAATNTHLETRFSTASWLSLTQPVSIPVQIAAKPQDPPAGFFMKSPPTRRAEARLVAVRFHQIQLQQTQNRFGSTFRRPRRSQRRNHWRQLLLDLNPALLIAQQFQSGAGQMIRCCR